MPLLIDIVFNSHKEIISIYMSPISEIQSIGKFLSILATKSIIISQD